MRTQGLFDFMQVSLEEVKPGQVFRFRDEVYIRIGGYGNRGVCIDDGREIILAYDQVVELVPGKFVVECD